MVKKLSAIIVLIVFTFVFPVGISAEPEADRSKTGDPTLCDYAPPGEYVKDHTVVYHDGWYHLFAISGTRGYYHGYYGNEECFSWSISKNLVDWEFRGHVIHASLREGEFDQNEVWAPFCLKANDRFYMFYTGVVHPFRPMEYRKLGHDHPGVWTGHKETQGLAVSTDMTDWVKVSDPQKGSGIPGRDSNIAWDDAAGRWLLYSTGGRRNIDGKLHNEVLVSQSQNLTDWEYIGVCALIPPLYMDRVYKGVGDDYMVSASAGTAESMVTMRHPVTGKWILLGNWHYVTSDDPVNFMNGEVKYYDNTYNGKEVDMGFAGEYVEHGGKWYRSGVMGERDYWRLGFTEIEWTEDGAFKIIKPSKVTNP